MLWESLTDADVLSISIILNQPKGASVGESTDDEENAVIEHSMHGVLTCISKLHLAKVNNFWRHYSYT